MSEDLAWRAPRFVAWAAPRTVPKPRWRAWASGVGVSVALAAGCPDPGPRTAALVDPAPGRALEAWSLEGLRLAPACSIGALAPPPTLPGVPQDARDHASQLPGDRSYSIGSASRGYLVRPVALPDGAGPLRARPISVRRKAIWGTQELVDALERAAARVAARWPGSVLWAGDLSARDGGDLPGHASHNSGRDADLAFYMRDAAGRVADRPDFPPLRSDGRSADGALTFDVPRNWALLEALMRDPRIQLQWVFVYAPLADALLAYAEQAAVDVELRRRAARIVRQPGDSSAHREHFHIRIHCALEERVEGCIETGPIRDWVDAFDEPLTARVAEVLPLLASGGTDEVRYAVTRIVRLQARVALPHVEDALRKARAGTATATLLSDAAAFLRGERVPPAWAHLSAEDVGE